MRKAYLNKEYYRTAMLFVRYGLVGLAINLCGYALFLLVTYLGVEAKKAMTMLYIVGATLGFYGHRELTFKHKEGLLHVGGKYLIAHATGYFINFVALYIFVDKLGYSHRLVQGGAIVLVAVFLFFAFRCFVFRNGEKIEVKVKEDV